LDAGCQDLVIGFALILYGLDEPGLRGCEARFQMLAFFVHHLNSYQSARFNSHYEACRSVRRFSSDPTGPSWSASGVDQKYGLLPTVEGASRRHPQSGKNHGG
jgi:hypothetical protein